MSRESSELHRMEAHIKELQAEVKLQSDSADHWEDEAMNHMSQAAKLQAQLEQTIKDGCDTGTKLFIANRRGAELQAELKRHKFAIGILYNRFREKEPMPRLWVDEAFALKEIASGD